MSAGDGGGVSIAAEGKILLPLVSAGHEGGDIAVYEYCFESKSVPRDEYISPPGSWNRHILFQE